MSSIFSDLIIPVLKGVLSTAYEFKEIIILIILAIIIKSIFPLILQYISISKVSRNTQPQNQNVPQVPLTIEDMETEETEITDLPYKPKFEFFSKAEKSFFKVLLLATREYNFHIFAKVRLADLVYLSKNSENWRTYFNKVQSKHVDFVVCDRETTKPLLIIELDDSSHKQDKRMLRDEFVDKVLSKAGLPILRVPAQYAYNVADISSKIRNVLPPKEEASTNSGCIG